MRMLTWPLHNSGLTRTKGILERSPSLSISVPAVSPILFLFLFVLMFVPQLFDLFCVG